MSIKITFPGNKKVDAEIGSFTIKTDQSIKDNGDGTAPAPFEYFLASIGTCAGIYVIRFCQVRNLPTEGIELEQKIVYDTVKKRIGKIKIEIKVPPSFPEKYHKALIRAADQCAVKKYMFEPPEFEIETKVTG